MCEQDLHHLSGKVNVALWWVHHSCGAVQLYHEVESTRNSEPSGALPFDSQHYSRTPQMKLLPNCAELKGIVLHHQHVQMVQPNPKTSKRMHTWRRGIGVAVEVVELGAIIIPSEFPECST